ncbi:Mu transposase domain-containing protein [Streptomyces sp. LMG1-1-1.1]|uniref:Mu transposase domain-containing protein n=1 Tax=Streptomyces sp. LMG1-1-1.1 TaxID=3135245 RepID=UPI003465B0B8
MNTRWHRASGQIPADGLDIERTTLHVLPLEPLAVALGEERVVVSDRTVSFNSVRYSTPPGYTGARVWRRVLGDELSITAPAPSPVTCWRVEDDLVSILEHIEASRHVGQVVRADEAHSVQNGTIAWQALGRQQTAAGESRAD